MSKAQMRMFRGRLLCLLQNAMCTLRYLDGKHVALVVGAFGAFRDCTDAQQLVMQAVETLHEMDSVSIAACFRGFCELRVADSMVCSHFLKYFLRRRGFTLRSLSEILCGVSALKSSRGEVASCLAFLSHDSAAPAQEQFGTDELKLSSIVKELCDIVAAAPLKFDVADPTEEALHCPVVCCEEIMRILFLLARVSHPMPSALCELLLPEVQNFSLHQFSLICDAVKNMDDQLALRYLNAIVPKLSHNDDSITTFDACRILALLSDKSVDEVPFVVRARTCLSSLLVHRCPLQTQTELVQSVSGIALLPGECDAVAIPCLLRLRDVVQMLSPSEITKVVCSLADLLAGHRHEESLLSAILNSAFHRATALVSQFSLADFFALCRGLRQLCRNGRRSALPWYFCKRLGRLAMSRAKDGRQNHRQFHSFLMRLTIGELVEAFALLNEIVPSNADVTALCDTIIYHAAMLNTAQMGTVLRSLVSYKHAAYAFSHLVPALEKLVDDMSLSDGVSTLVVLSSLNVQLGQFEFLEERLKHFVMIHLKELPNLQLIACISACASLRLGFKPIMLVENASGEALPEAPCFHRRGGELPVRTIARPNVLHETKEVVDRNFITMLKVQLERLLPVAKAPYFAVLVSAMLSMHAVDENLSAAFWRRIKTSGTDRGGAFFEEIQASHVVMLFEACEFMLSRRIRREGLPKEWNHETASEMNCFLASLSSRASIVSSSFRVGDICAIVAACAALQHCPVTLFSHIAARVVCTSSAFTAENIFVLLKGMAAVLEHSTRVHPPAVQHRLAVCFLARAVQLHQPANNESATPAFAQWETFTEAQLEELTTSIVPSLVRLGVSPAAQVLNHLKS